MRRHAGIAVGLNRPVDSFRIANVRRPYNNAQQ